MNAKKTFVQSLVHKTAQAIVNRELSGWPPDTPWSIYQPHRPEKPLPKPQEKQEKK